MFASFFCFEKEKISRLTQWDLSLHMMNAKCAETIPNGGPFKLSNFSVDISKFRISGLMSTYLLAQVCSIVSTFLPRY